MQGPVDPDPSRGSTASLVGGAASSPGTRMALAALALVLAAGGFLRCSEEAPPPAPELAPAPEIEEAPAPTILHQEGQANVSAGYLEAQDRVVVEHGGVTIGLEGRLRIGDSLRLDAGAVGVATTTPVVLDVASLSVHGAAGRFGASRGEDLRVFVGEGSVEVRRSGQSWTVEAGQTLVSRAGEVTVQELPQPLERLVHAGPWTGEVVEVEAVQPTTADLAALRSQLKRGEAEAVKEQLLAHLAEHPEDGEAWSLMAEARRALGETEAELDAWTRASRHAPRVLANEAHLEAARLADDEVAVQHLEALLANEPGGMEPEARLELGRKLVDMGDRRGRNVLNQLIQRFPDSEAAKEARSLL